MCDTLQCKSLVKSLELSFRPVLWTLIIEYTFIYQNADKLSFMLIVYTNLFLKENLTDSYECHIILLILVVPWDTMLALIQLIHSQTQV